MFVLGIMGLIFGIYHYFKNPQIDLEKSEGINSLTIQNIQRDLVNLRDNHVHSLDVKLDETNKTVSGIAIEVAKLATIIDERIPRK